LIAALAATAKKTQPARALLGFMGLHRSRGGAETGLVFAKQLNGPGPLRHKPQCAAMLTMNDVTFAEWIRWFAEVLK